MTANGNTLGDAIYDEKVATDLYHPNTRNKSRDRALAEALLKKMVRFANLSAAAESGDDIVVTIQIKDGGEANVAETTTLRAALYDSEMKPPGEAAFSMAETGAGAEVTDTAMDGLILTTDANGAAELTVSDEVGASDTTIQLLVEVLSSSGLVIGQTRRLALTFDNA